MKKMMGCFGPILTIVVALVISACGPSRMTSINPAQQMRGQGSTENPVELVNRLGEEITTARINQLNVLSPGWFRKAEDAYLDAKKDLEKGAELVDIRKNVIAAKAHLQQAEEIAKVSRTTLPNTIEARQRARNAGATKFDKDYADVESRFRSLTQAIEKNNLRYAQKNRKKVSDMFRELELRAIKDDTIGEVRRLIRKAEAAGARKLAPAAYKQAVDQLQAADDFITQHPYDKENMLKMANEALFLARRTGVVTEQARQVKEMEPEAIVLWDEKGLLAISSALGAPDMRDHEYQTQLDNIIGSIQSLQGDRDFVAQKNKDLLAEMASLKKAHKAQVEALNERLAALEGKSREEQLAKEKLAKERLAAEERLSAERRFIKQYEQVSEYFPKNEAEVYKQENQLVLRLKAIQFPVGQAIIMPENYNVLSKVQRAIRTFNDPRVIVEGHTDTTGSDEVNQVLSQKRADAVREYLIANQTLPADRIVAVGYGSARPLASNATFEGRAINRRIDVIVTPKVQSLP